jgi:putative glutamine amidotransferase
MRAPRIAIPVPSSRGVSADAGYNERAWKQYAKAVEAAVGVAVRVPLEEGQEGLARIASSCVGVLLPGSGADVDPEKYGEKPIAACGRPDPAREAADELLLQDAFNLQKPILGICYGLQSLNVWRNGTLIQDIPQALARGGEGRQEDLPNHAAGRTVERAHSVELTSGTRLASILRVAAEADAADAADTMQSGEIVVNSSHHQAVGRPGDQLRIAAKSPADDVIEALEGETSDQFVLGVQWHPERTYEESPASRALFAAFIRAATEWRPRPIDVSVAR